MKFGFATRVIGFKQIVPGDNWFKQQQQAAKLLEAVNSPPLLLEKEKTTFKDNETVEAKTPFDI